MAEFTQTINFGTKDKFNALGASASLQTLVGEEVNVEGLAFANDVNEETGEVTKVAYIKTSKGIVSTISDTVIRALSELTEFDEFVKGGSVTFNVLSRKSNNGRDFLVLEMV